MCKNFVKVRQNGRTILQVRGTKTGREIQADQIQIIMGAIADGLDIDILSADIEDDMVFG